jgi:hypothetical protein
MQSPRAPLRPQAYRAACSGQRQYVVRSGLSASARLRALLAQVHRFQPAHR